MKGIFTIGILDDTSIEVAEISVGDHYNLLLLLHPASFILKELLHLAGPFPLVEVHQGCHSCKRKRQECHERVFVAGEEGVRAESGPVGCEELHLLERAW